MVQTEASKAEDLKRTRGCGPATFEHTEGHYDDAGWEGEGTGGESMSAETGYGRVCQPGRAGNGQESLILS